VEESLYRVHRSHLERNSDYFRQYLLKNGTDSCNPIMIPGVSQQDFDILLQFLYEDIFDMESISIDAWFVLLSISATLHFRKIHQLAIQYITPHLPELDPVDIIPMANKFHIQDWLDHALMRLSGRPQALSDEEAERIGSLKIVARIARIRERLIISMIKHSEGFTPIASATDG
ncbi:hypothetical protein C8Q75DRAFT_726388, partial [Abortiporus biennis]